MATTKNFAEIIRRELDADVELAAAVDDERFRINAGAEIFEARTRAGLSQRELAELAGMQQSAIARLEDADYEGHSLKTLRRIAKALGKRVQVAFVEQYPTVEVPLLAYTLRFPAQPESGSSAASAYVGVSAGCELQLDPLGRVVESGVVGESDRPTISSKNRTLVA